MIDGKSVWVIVNGEIQTEECMKNGISAHDLMFKLRAAGIYEISAVKRAVMEQTASSPSFSTATKACVTP